MEKKNFVIGAKSFSFLVESDYFLASSQQFTQLYNDIDLAYNFQLDRESIFLLIAFRLLEGNADFNKFIHEKNKEIRLVLSL